MSKNTEVQEDLGEEKGTEDPGRAPEETAASAPSSPPLLHVRLLSNREAVWQTAQDWKELSHAYFFST